MLAALANELPLPGALRQRALAAIPRAGGGAALAAAVTAPEARCPATGAVVDPWLLFEGGVAGAAEERAGPRPLVAAASEKASAWLEGAVRVQRS